MRPLLCFALFTCSIFNNATSKPSQPTDIRQYWSVDDGGVARAMQTGIGFAFNYGDTRIGPSVPASWAKLFVRGNQSQQPDMILSSNSGLVARRETRTYPESGAIEYKVIFKNKSRVRLHSLSSIDALYVSFDIPASDSICLISSGGGMADTVFPPRNFAVRKNCFPSPVTYENSISLTTEGGRSSNKDLPFFYIQNETRNDGIFVGLGWSGQWAATAKSDSTGVITLSARIPDVNVELEPGEEMAGPTVLIGAYRGALSDGINQLRRLIKNVYTPKLEGRAMAPVAIYDHFFYVEDNFDENLLEKLIDAASGMEQEYFLLDAGWFSPAPGGGFLPGVGNWEVVDKEKFPNGLKPVSEYVSAKGMKFGLWFEPERVGSNSKLAQDHHDWILWDHERESETSFNRSLEDPPYNGSMKTHFGLLDYSRSEVRQWIESLLDRYISDYGIKYIRYDFNIDPLSYWNAHDLPNRRGITQINYIQGFYSVIDWLRERHPATIFEGCASGGRRIDLETVKRFHAFWISDSSIDPSIIRFHLFGINKFLPGNYNYAQYSLPYPGQFPKQQFEPDDLGFESLFGGSFGIGGRIDLWPQYMKEKAIRHVRVWKSLRRYLMEDYYSLESQPQALDSWNGWQFQRAEDGSGFVQTFRTRTQDSSHTFRIQHLDRSSRYKFVDAYSFKTFVVSGESAMDVGITVTQDPMSSRVFLYDKTTEVSDNYSERVGGASQRVATRVP